MHIYIHPPWRRSKKGIPEPVDFVFCVGDDRTDEDMFQVLKLFRQVPTRCCC